MTEKTKPLSVQPWKWRWLGYRRWHRWAVGPLCLTAALDRIPTTTGEQQ